MLTIQIVCFSTKTSLLLGFTLEGSVSPRAVCYNDALPARPIPPLLWCLKGEIGAEAVCQNTWQKPFCGATFCPVRSEKWEPPPCHQIFKNQNANSHGMLRFQKRNIPCGFADFREVANGRKLFLARPGTECCGEQKESWGRNGLSVLLSQGAVYFRRNPPW